MRQSRRGGAVPQVTLGAGAAAGSLVRGKVGAMPLNSPSDLNLFPALGFGRCLARPGRISSLCSLKKKKNTKENNHCPFLIPASQFCSETGKDSLTLLISAVVLHSKINILNLCP